MTAGFVSSHDAVVHGHRTALDVALGRSGEDSAAAAPGRRARL
ncbi:hypothetical protein [Actinoplanes siamensis]|nr:hypothetical protein [Actinoplanes siamensis]